VHFLLFVRFSTGVAAVAIFGDLAIQDSDLLGTWAMLTWLVFIVGCLILIGTIPSVAARLPRVRFSKVGGKVSAEYLPPTWQGVRGLRTRADAASRGVLDLLAEYSRTDPSRVPWFHEPGWDDKTDAEQTAAFHAHGQKSSEHLAEYLRRYEVELSAECLAVFDAARDRGLTATTDRHRFEWPVNTFGLREVGQQLGVWARQL
jgi:hypothetical protein